MITPPIVDCDVWIGEHDPRPGSEDGRCSPAALMAEMDRLGVDLALTYHRQARAENAKAGNDQLLEATADVPRLLPALVVSPSIQEGYGDREALTAALGRTGVPAVRMFPDEHGYQLDGQACRPLLEALSRLGTVVVLRGQAVRQDGFGYDELTAFCDRYRRAGTPQSGLQVVLTEPSGVQGLYSRGLDDVVDALLDTENLYVDTRKLQFPDAVERIATECGPDRLLFGSQYPAASLGAAIGNVLLSALSVDVQRQIFATNLANLLGLTGRGWMGARETPVRPFPTVSYGLIDLHGHLRKGVARGNGFPPAGEIVTQLDRTDIELTCVSDVWNDQAGNDYVADAATQYPDRLVPIAAANPHWADLRGELVRCFDQLGMRLIKVHPVAHEVPPEDDRYGPVWEFANERAALVVTHARCTDEERAAFREIAQAHPEMTLMLYHAGRSWDTAENFLELAETCENVVLEITMSTVPDGIIEYLVRACGPEQVFFGTDLGFRSPESQVGWALAARLDADERRMVLRENGLRLLDRMDALPDATDAPRAL